MDLLSGGVAAFGCRSFFVFAINKKFWGRDELSFVVFTAQDRAVPAPGPRRDGAVDADAGGKAEPRAPAAERGILRAARNIGRSDLPAALACRPRLAFLVPARRRAAGRALGGTDPA